MHGDREEKVVSFPRRRNTQQPKLCGKRLDPAAVKRELTGFAVKTSVMNPRQTREQRWMALSFLMIGVFGLSELVVVISHPSVLSAVRATLPSTLLLIAALIWKRLPMHQQG